LTYLVRGGLIIDGTGRPPFAGDVLVEGRHIRAVGSTAEVAELAPLDAEIVDATGKWVLPGLVNAHEHLALRGVIGHPALAPQRSVVVQTATAIRNAADGLARGWTTVRDMGSRHAIALELRDLIASGAVPGPRVVACGSPICATGGHAFHICVEADGADACRRAAREQLKAGADFLKVMASHDPYPMPGPQHTRAELDDDEVRAVYAEARRWGKRTACHAMGSIAIGVVLDAGVDVVDHGIYLDKRLAERYALHFERQWTPASVSSPAPIRPAPTPKRCGSCATVAFRPWTASARALASPPRRSECTKAWEC
jgi:imidazolonepropionase-like amidohydrolase